MDRINNRIAHVYGYAVCLTAVIVMFFAVKQIVDAAINLSDPLRADSGGYGRMGLPLTDFELYKVEARHRPRFQTYPQAIVPTAVDPADTSEVELRRLYDAERSAAIDSARFRATRSLTGNLLLIIFAGVLFGIHWRWLKHRDVLPDTA
ncbi:MAG: hypothetical protein ACJ78M_02275 [Gemmatimonadaceae bacterium]